MALMMGTIMLVAGIPMIPVGFSLGYTFLGIIGIVFTAVGFYGCPLAWSAFGGYAPMVRVVYAIEHESMYSVSEIATYLRKNEKTVQGKTASLQQDAVSLVCI